MTPSFRRASTGLTGSPQEPLFVGLSSGPSTTLAGGLYFALGPYGPRAPPRVTPKRRLPKPPGGFSRRRRLGYSAVLDPPGAGQPREASWSPPTRQRSRVRIAAVT